MATTPDQWLDKTAWTKIADAQTFMAQVLDGAACFAWSDTAPTVEYGGARIGHGGMISGEGTVWAKAAFADTQTKITVTTDISAPGFLGGLL